ncbi:MAG: hypothetical protein HYX54_06385 [Chloroflexi bacterium]|nr:hypothetical protein [Chloroflexota bacterium]
MTTRIAVAIESTPKRTFASAVDWPGFARSGTNEAAAIAALLAHLDRYATVARAAGESLPAHDVLIEVVETAAGNGSTEFGVPGRVTAADRRPTTTSEAERLARLVTAAWACLDTTVAAAPESLRKGPRGGGRDTSKIAEHALLADHAYAREMGLRVPAPVPAPVPGDAVSVRALRDAMLAVLRQPADGSALADRRWTVRYAAHRIGWHALDHAWEIEDRTEDRTGDA